MSKLVVACETDALDDWEFDGDDNLVAPGGRPVALWLFDALGQMAQPLTPPENHEDYGWSFELKWAGKRSWFLIAMGPGERTMYVWVEPHQSWIDRRLGRVDRRKEVFEAITELLTRDSRFENVRIQSPPRK